MKNVLKRIECTKTPDIKRRVDARIEEFKDLGKKNNNELFKEICFCILTANYQAEGGIRIQKEVGDGFIRLSESDLAKKLKELGHRFPNTRAKYIVEARAHKDKLKEVVGMKDRVAVREWIVHNIKGLGFKEASHFLRNIGLEDYAIIDFHIVDFLVDSGLIKKPKNLNKARYLEIEDVLKRIADQAKMSLGELDLYLWYCETGKVLK